MTCAVYESYVKPVNVSRMEKDTSKLAALYQEGHDIADKTVLTFF